MAAGTLQTLERGIAVLQAVAASETGLRIDEIAERLGVHRAIAYRLVNTLAERDKAVAAASALVGAGNVDPDNPPINAADDFAFMLLQRPGCNVMMGNGDDPKWTSNHRPDYDFNDEALCHGAAYWISLTDKELNPDADLGRDAA